MSNNRTVVSHCSVCWKGFNCCHSLHVQVLNGIKAGKAKLVLLAPDTECSDVSSYKFVGLIVFVE